MLETISQISVNERAPKAATTNILLVEKDNQLAQLIAQELSCEGYQISLTADGISGLLAACQTHPHLIIVGWSLWNTLYRVLSAAPLNLQLCSHYCLNPGGAGF